ncbi:hypothetical protein [Cohaesibacter sp. ES.047]|uniref:hypothetical protein n=1 Tax=Cohaesibacter sp. ES.047 TaxID=1798205 RepID=UPI0012FE2B7C|nr:hypothetical protein [Cohaesibacter sp. ES.047]
MTSKTIKESQCIPSCAPNFHETQGQYSEIQANSGGCSEGLNDEQKTATKAVLFVVPIGDLLG